MRDHAHALLTEIYISKEVTDITRQLKPSDRQEDIKQHAFCELYAKPGEFIVDLHNRGKLKAYVVKIMYNTATYHRTPFTKEFGEMGRELPTDIEAQEKLVDIRHVDEHKTHAEVSDNLDRAMKKLYWYNRELLKLYSELGSYQAVSEQTGIPLTSVFITITETKKAIKKLL